MSAPNFPTEAWEPKGAESSPAVSARSPLNRLVRENEGDDAGNPSYEKMNTPGPLSCQDTR
jgi:hypothetical protein